MSMLVLGTAMVIVAIGAVAIRRSRAAGLAGLRANWGRPIDREHRFGALALTHRSRVCHAGSTGSLDDRTWADLNLDQVFAVIDRTQGTLGQHALYHRMRTSPLGDHLESFERLVSRMASDTAARERAQVALSRLQDPHGYDLWWLAQPNAIDCPRWFAVFPVLTGAGLLLLIATALMPQWLPAMFAILTLNVCLRWFTWRHITALAPTFRQLPPVIAAGQSLGFLTQEADAILASIRSDGQRLGRLKNLARWFTGDPLLLPMTSPAHAVFLSDVVNVIYEYFNLVLLLDATGIYLGAGELRRKSAPLLRLAAAAGEVDAAISVASLRENRSDWVRPVFESAGAGVVMADMRHPLVAAAVPNTVVSRLGTGMLVTGPNMSGKSTFLRAAGVSAIMAQTLNTCFASAYVAPVLRVRSCIGRGDDLIAGKSYYLAEIEALLGLVNASSEAAPHLFLLDELFRGTNAIDRIAAAEAVLAELLRQHDQAKPHIVVAATHDAELVNLLAEIYEPHHFGDAVGEGGLIFDHRLRPGPATTRNAIALLRLQGAPDTLVDRAMTRAAALERTGAPRSPRGDAAAGWDIVARADSATSHRGQELYRRVSG